MRRAVVQPPLFLASLVLVWSAAATAGQDQPPVTKVATAGVLIDATVVDRKGQPVLDLRPDEFELTEDGKRQQIVTVTLVTRGTLRAIGGASAASGNAPATPGQSLPESSGRHQATDNTSTVTALLFDRLEPESRGLAYRAALTCISTLSPDHDRAGVFLADTTLAMVQPFTTSQEALQKAILALAGRPTLQNAERAGSSRVQQLPLDPNRPATAGAEFGSSWANAREREALLNVPGPEGVMRRLELRMWEGYQQLLSEYEGQISIAGLRATVDALAQVPGRKSILYFADNVPVSQRLKPAFEALIGQANRNNVTIYPVDAAGLRVHSKEAELGRNVEVAGAQGLGEAKRDSGAWTKELERQEQLLTSRPTAILGRLAKETGGFLLENTNDLAAGMSRIRDERTSYYLLAYQPANAVADSKFRRISVKVKRSQVTVKARPGYVMSPGR